VINTTKSKAWLLRETNRGEPEKKKGVSVKVNSEKRGEVGGKNQLRILRKKASN